MTDEKKEEEPFFKDEELDEMFNVSFLPMLQEFARRAKEKRCSGKDIAFFNVQMHLQFSELEKPITYGNVKDKITLHLRPVPQEDLDKANENALKEDT